MELKNNYLFYVNAQPHCFVGLGYVIQYLCASYILCHCLENQVAFSAGLADKKRCVGPVKTALTVTYQSIFINIGEAYNSTTGVFLVPRSGVYNLALTAFSDAGSPGALLAICVSIRQNGVALAALREKYDQDQEDQATVVLLVELRAGDRITVSLQPGCWLCDDQNHYNTFSGFLLYARE